MKSSFQKLIGMMLPVLLPLLLGILLISAAPSYNSDSDRIEYIQEEYSNAEIISQNVYPKYIICEFRCDDGIGYCLFQKILGRWQYDHAVISQDTIALGDFYMGDTFYHAIITDIDNAASVEISYVNITSAEIVRQITMDTQGRTMFVVAAAKDNHEIHSISFLDASGNPLN